MRATEHAELAGRIRVAVNALAVERPESESRCVVGIISEVDAVFMSRRDALSCAEALEALDRRTHKRERLGPGRRAYDGAPLPGGLPGTIDRRRRRAVQLEIE